MHNAPAIVNNDGFGELSFWCRYRRKASIEANADY